MRVTWRHLLALVIFLVGFGGIVAQVLLLRELLIVFFGNELSIGIILANWLLMEALGSGLLGRLVDATRRRMGLFILTQTIFSISLPAAVYCTRISKELVGSVHGEGLGLLQIFYISLAILAIPALTHGALFTFSYRLWSANRRRILPATRPERKSATGDSRAAESAVAGRVYVLETLGTIAGGIIFTYVLLTALNSMQIAFSIAAANFAACLVLAIGTNTANVGNAATADNAKVSEVSRPLEKGRQGGIGRPLLAVFSLALLVLSLAALVGPWAQQIHVLSYGRQFMGQKVLHYENSIYANLVLAERAGQYTLYANGLPAVTAPLPEVENVESLAHLPLLFHPNPRRVLVIGSGVGGLLAEVLKHPIERLDYCELDPQVLHVLRLFPTELIEGELTDKRVHVEHIDGRVFVATASSERSYDVILLGLSPQADLQVNRLFTAAFFSHARMSLRDHGILAFAVPGSATYLEDERARLNASLLETLRGVFRYVRVLPGDRNLYLASDWGHEAQPEFLSVGPEELLVRAEQRGVMMATINPVSLEFGYFHGLRMEQFTRAVERVKARPNADFRPAGVFYSAAYWTAMYAPGLRKVFQWIEDIRAPWVVGVFVGVLGLLVVVRLIFPARTERAAVSLAIATSGFCGMLFDLVLIFAFQAMLGYLFHQIGLLMTMFMMGTAVGGLWMSRRLVRSHALFEGAGQSGNSISLASAEAARPKFLTLFLSFELSVLIVSVALPLILMLIGDFGLKLWGATFARFVFFFLAFVAGVPIGAQFPLANRLLLGHPMKMQSAAFLLPLPEGEVGLSGSHEFVSPIAAARQRLAGTVGGLYAADLMGGWLAGIVGGVFLLPLLGVAGTCIVAGSVKLASGLLIVLGRKARNGSGNTCL